MDFRTILFPADFSGRCRAGGPYVRAMARLFDSSVLILRVSDNQDSHSFEMRPAPRSARALAAMARDCFEGLTVTPAVCQGNPATEIRTFAETRDIGPIVTPTRGTGRLLAALLGSVTARVLNNSACDVRTSTHPEYIETRCAGKIRSLLSAIDLSPERPIAHPPGTSARHTHRGDGQVRSLGAGRRSGIPGGPQDPIRTLLKDAARISVIRFQQETGTTFELCLQAGRPSRVIEDAALHHQADLAIVGRGKKHRLGGPLRTEACAIIRDRRCPVLSF